MINSNTSFAQLKEIIVGRELEIDQRLSDITFRQFYREALGEKVYEEPFKGYEVSIKLIEQRNKELDGLATILSKYGIKVYRPDKVKKIISFSTPDFQSELSSASNVRDVSLIYKNKIIETPVFVRNRYFENTAIYNIYNQAYDLGRGGEWIKAPNTKLTKDRMDLGPWTEKRDYGNKTNLSKYVMAIDGAQYLKIGKDVIVNISSYNHFLGHQWVSSFFPETTFHIVNFVDNHIDGVLTCLRPGVFLINPKYPNIKSAMPKKFQKWTYLYPKDIAYKIDTTEMSDIDIQLASSRGLDINVLSINESLVAVSRRAVGVAEVLNKNGFDLINIDLNHGEIFAGGIHCSTLDLVRKDEYIYY